MKLSDHFSLEEMTKSQTALRKNIPNTPTEAHTEALTNLCINLLEPIRWHFRKAFTPSSGYRSPELCVAIGSSLNSQHARAEAADFEVVGVDNCELADWIKRELPYDQLILEFYTPGEPNSGWIHCSYTEGTPRASFLHAFRSEGKTKYKPIIGNAKDLFV